MAQGNENNLYFTDSPIETPEQDILGRNAFVEQFAQTITSRQSKESLVIAFYGPWGSGKSSVLNLLQQRIASETREKIGIVRFDPWYFNSQEQLLQTFFGELSRSLLLFTKDKSIANVFKRYANALSVISVEFKPKFSLGPISVDLGSVTNKGNESPENLRQNIQKSVYAANAKVLILIDNLDRLDPPELLLMFKLVRLCSDFPGFIFILAFDHEQVLNLLKKGEVDINFLEKMIQVDIDLPVIDQAQIDRLVMKSLDKITIAEGMKPSQDTSERFINAYNNYVSGIAIPNLRSAKRYLNAITFSFPLIKDEVDYSDFLLLEVLRVFFPDIHESIYLHREEFTNYDAPIWNDVNVGFDYQSSSERVKFFKSFTEIIGEKRKTMSKDIVVGLLCELFPTFREFIINPTKPKAVKFEQEFVIQKRLADINHFNKYFQLQILTYDIPTSELEQFVSRLTNERDEQAVFSAISKYFDQGKLSRFFNKIPVYLGDIPASSKLVLAKAIASFSANFNDTIMVNDIETLSDINSVSIDAIRFLLKILKTLTDDNRDAKEIVNYIFLSSTSIRFSLLSFAAFARRVDLVYASKKYYAQMLSERIKSEIVDKKLNIFTAYPDSFLDIILLWSDLAGISGRADLERYLEELTKVEPASIAKFLSAFLVLDENNILQLDYDSLTRCYNEHHVMSAIKKLSDMSAFSPDEVRAIKEFTGIYLKQFPELEFRAESTFEISDTVDEKDNDWNEILNTEPSPDSDTPEQPNVSSE